MIRTGPADTGGIVEAAGSTARPRRAAALPGRPISDPSEWRGAELAARDGWFLHFDDGEIRDLLDMCRSVRAVVGADPRGLIDLPPGAFDLGRFADKLGHIRAELKDGAGVVMLRGLPLGDMEAIDAAIAYWAIGRRLGKPVSNNPEGDLLGHVTDLDKDYRDANVRGYQTRATMDYHCDQCAIVGLLCLRTAKSGGRSKLASSAAIYNALLARRPDLVAVLTEPLCWSKHGEVDPGAPGYYESPVFNFLDGYLCTSFGPAHIRKGHALPEAPDMTDAQREAIAVAEDLAEEFRHELDFEVGDIQFANNFVILHTRAAFEDWPEKERKRLLWRLWLVDDDLRPPTPYALQWRRGVSLSRTAQRIRLS